MTGHYDHDYFHMNGMALGQRLLTSSFKRQYFVTAEKLEAENGTLLCKRGPDAQIGALIWATVTKISELLC